jgi:hypothetical protein
MKRNIFFLFISIGLLLFSMSCDKLWPDTYWRSEKYVLLAVDAKSQMSLSFDTNDGSALGLVGPTVFAIGADEKYIVLKQHPAIDPHASAFNRSVTNYFIIERSQSPSFEERQRHVNGPMNKEAFEGCQRSLSLPTFTKTFNDLQ